MARDLNWKAAWPGFVGGLLTGGLGFLVASALDVEGAIPILVVFVLTGVVVGLCVGLVSRFLIRRSDPTG